MCRSYSHFKYTQGSKIATQPPNSRTAHIPLRSSNSCIIASKNFLDDRVAFSGCVAVIGISNIHTNPPLFLPCRIRETAHVPLTSSDSCMIASKIHLHDRGAFCGCVAVIGISNIHKDPKLHHSRRIREQHTFRLDRQILA